MFYPILGFIGIIDGTATVGFKEKGKDFGTKNYSYLILHELCIKVLNNILLTYFVVGYTKCFQWVSKGHSLGESL